MFTWKIVWAVCSIELAIIDTQWCVYVSVETSKFELRNRKLLIEVFIQATHGSHGDFVSHEGHCLRWEQQRRYNCRVFALLRRLNRLNRLDPKGHRRIQPLRFRLICWAGWGRSSACWELLGHPKNSREKIHDQWCLANLAVEWPSCATCEVTYGDIFLHLLLYKRSLAEVALGDWRHISMPQMKALMYKQHQATAAVVAACEGYENCGHAFKQLHHWMGRIVWAT